MSRQLDRHEVLGIVLAQVADPFDPRPVDDKEQEFVDHLHDLEQMLAEDGKPACVAWALRMFETIVRERLVCWAGEDGSAGAKPVLKRFES